MKKTLQTWVRNLANAGTHSFDTEDQRLQKAVLTFLASIYCILGALWGVAYLLLRLPLCASIPFVYSVLSAAALFVFFRTKRYGLFRFSQLVLILILPFMLQWGLGGFAASSAVMIWSILSPIGALMFAGTRQALPWFLAYLLLMAISGIFDIRLVEHAKTLPRLAVAGFFFMNIAAVSSTAFLLLRYFVHKRELAMKALGEEHKRVSQERERLAKIKSVLAYFVPETAKSIIEKDPDKALLEKYIQDATVLFLDIEAFTTLVQKYPHDRINRAIESYFSTFFDLIQKRGGDINETAGDGMMVIFLNPDPIMHAKNAVKTALEIQRKCEQYTEMGNPDLFSIRVNIGISSGEVYLGSTKMRGTEGDRWTFTASGPVTILAARLSEYGNGGQVLVGGETARRIGESFSLASLGEVNLKNIEVSGEVFQVLAAQKDDDVQNP